VAAEPVREEPTGHEETRAILPEGFVDIEAEREVVLEAKPEAEPQVLFVAEPQAHFEVEPPAVPEPDEELVFAEDAAAEVVDASEVEAFFSSTILMASADEVAEL
jgi:hypothetical protein